MKAAELETLGRRAVACKHWRWMPGMTILGSKGRRVVVLGLSGAPEATSGMSSRAIDPDELPDLSSPATLGCLLHLVEEAYGHVGIMWSGGEWECWVDVGGSQFNFTGLTKQEALVNALERVEHWKG